MPLRSPCRTLSGNAKKFSPLVQHPSRHFLEAATLQIGLQGFFNLSICVCLLTPLSLSLLQLLYYLLDYLF